MVEWRLLPETGSNYYVSDDGRVWSLPRPGSSGGELALTSDHWGYAMVCLYRDGRRSTRTVHRLVLETFVGPSGDLEARHLDGNPSNNHLSNLAWGTHSENMMDTVRHRSHNGSRKSYCPKGHPYSPENTHVRPTGQRACKTCNRESSRLRMRKYNRGSKAC